MANTYHSKFNLLNKNIILPISLSASYDSTNQIIVKIDICLFFTYTNVVKSLFFRVKYLNIIHAVKYNIIHYF